MNTITDTKVIPKRPPKQEKIDQVSTIRDLLERSQGVIITDYRGFTVAEKTELTKRLRAAGAEYHVVKNTLFKIAYEGDAAVNPLLEGPTAVAFALQDPVAPAKTITDFIRESRKGVVKGGVVSNQLYSPEQVDQLAKLPTRDVLLGQVVGAIQSPLYGLVGTLQGVINNFVWTLQAIHDQKQGVEA